jgi:hypothetical protein
MCGAISLMFSAPFVGGRQQPCEDFGKRLSERRASSIHGGVPRNRNAPVVHRTLLAISG